jgi:hypothetical protein
MPRTARALKRKSPPPLRAAGTPTADASAHVHSDGLRPHQFDKVLSDLAAVLEVKALKRFEGLQCHPGATGVMPVAFKIAELAS